MASTRAPTIDFSKFTTTSSGTSFPTSISTHTFDSSQPTGQQSGPKAAVASSGKGGGSFRSISENLEVNPANGTLSLSIPIPTTKARSDFGPKLSLSYSSGQGNGPFGFGCNVPVLSISRKTSKKVPVYDDDEDTFVLAGEDDLVPRTSGPDIKEQDLDGYTVRQYLPRVVTRVQRIERWTSKVDGTDVFWKTISSENVTSIFGKTAASRITDNASTQQRLFSWLLCQTYDPYGNCMKFSYKQEDSKGIDVDTIWEQNRPAEIRNRQKYLKSIQYGNATPNRDLQTWDPLPNDQKYLFEVVFDYGEHDEFSPRPGDKGEWKVRADAFSTSRCGFELRTYRLCRRILMFHHIDGTGREDHLVSSCRLQYSEAGGGSFLSKFQQLGHTSKAPNLPYIDESLPSLDFTYATAPSAEELNLKKVQTANLPSLPSTFSAASEWIDLNGEGTPGILSRLDDGTISYQRNKSVLDDSDSGYFEGDEVLSCQPSLHANGSHYFEDLEGDGKQSLVCLDEQDRLLGYFQRESSDYWSDFATFKSAPSQSLTVDESTRVDLTGDGLADFLHFQRDGSLTWSPCLGKEGFDAQRSCSVGPTIPLYRPGDETAVTQFADMTGDGLSDLVQITNASIRYWPNLGYGCFGDSIDMGSPPVLDRTLNFHASRVQLLDADGSGTTDLVYILPGGGANIYYNLAGNSWSDADSIPNFPAIDTASSVLALDLFGRGTSCLAWTGPTTRAESGMSMQYLDLMGPVKPHVLTGYTNGFGLETKVEYLPSTHYYLDDEAQGLKWISSIPFPVQCVSTLAVTDHITRSFKKIMYKYHDGSYNGKESEFNGFGMVEERSEERFETPTGPLTSPSTLTKSWFSTDVDSDTSSQPYWSQQQLKNRLAPNLEADEMPGALRAIKGLLLRSETYGVDGSGLADIPYSTVERSYGLQKLQGRSFEIDESVFISSPSETITTVLERQKGDARITHELVLKVNQYGDVERSARIFYPRATKIKELADEVWQEQSKLHLQVTETEYTNVIDIGANYREPVPWKTKTYHVDAEPLEHGLLFTVDLLNALFDGASSDNSALWSALLSVASYIFAFLSFFSLISRSSTSSAEQTSSIPTEDAVKPTASIPSRPTLLSETRTLYRKSDLSSDLDPGILEAYSVVGVTYNLALTASMTDELLSKFSKTHKVAKSDLETLGGYLELYKNGNMWTSTARSNFTKDKEVGKELQAARKSFYTPSLTTDSFKNTTSIKMDGLALFTVESTNALGVSTFAKVDYERMQVKQVIDENQNAEELKFDGFGNTIGYAALGAAGELGDSFDVFSTEVDQEHLDAFFDFPTKEWASRLLGTATRRTIFDLDRYQRLGGSACPCVVEIMRTQSGPGRTQSGPGGNPDLRIELTYLDGYGRAIQRVHLYGEDKDSQWHISGCGIQDSKGQVLRTYLPKFSNDSAFILPTKHDTAFVQYFFDPLGRSVAQVNADGTWSKSVYKPWSKSQYDAGDTILCGNATADADVGRYFKCMMSKEAFTASWYDRRSKSENKWDNMAAEKSKVYHDTPHISLFDPSGQSICELEHAGDVKHSTGIKYDIFGNRSETYDSLGGLTERQVFDCLGNCTQILSMDSGHKWMIPNCNSVPIFSGNSCGVVWKMVYDELQREKQVFLTTSKETEKLYKEFTYGEKHFSATRANLSGKVWEIKDQSGVTRHEFYDRYGNCTQTTTQFAAEYKSVIDWKDEHVDLVRQSYRTRYSFDNSGQLLESTDAHGTSTRRSYTRLGNVKQVEVKLNQPGADWKDYISSSSFTADQRCLQSTYGNGTMKIREYDPKSRLLIAHWVIDASGTALEHLSHTYDCTGRKVQTIDSAQQDLYFRNAKIRPACDYTYDAFGQLIKATGREQIDASNGSKGALRPYQPWRSSSSRSSGDDAQMCEYIETFAYDNVGRISSMQHQPASDTSLSGWTRTYSYEEPSLLEPNSKSNRLSKTSIGKIDEPYGYAGDGGEVGCITAMAGFSSLRWDANNMLQASSSQTFHAGTPETTYYVYDHKGDRVRKVTEREAAPDTKPTMLKESLYLAGADVHIKYNGDGSVKSTRSTSEVVGEGKLALLESDSAFAQDVLVRYQVSDRLELDDVGRVVSYEEYSAFGYTVVSSTKQKNSAPRKYRFAAYHRDNETGLYLCGARYYAPWIGRWVSPDPLGQVDGPDLYAYVGNDPVNYTDPTGFVKQLSEHELERKIKKHSDALELRLSNMQPHLSGDQSKKTDYSGSVVIKNPYNFHGSVAAYAKIASLTTEAAMTARSVGVRPVKMFGNMHEIFERDNIAKPSTKSAENGKEGQRMQAYHLAHDLSNTGPMEHTGDWRSGRSASDRFEFIRSKMPDIAEFRANIKAELKHLEKADKSFSWVVDMKAKLKSAKEGLDHAMKIVDSEFGKAKTSYTKLENYKAQLSKLKDHKR